MILFSFVSVNILGNLYWENISKNVIDCRLMLVNLTLFNELNQRCYMRCSFNGQTRITETLPNAMHFHEMSSLKIDAQTYKIKS